jgi:Domain of unknown function (DUF4868)
MAILDPAKFPRKKLAKLVADATVQVVFGYRNSATDWDFQRLPLHGGLQEEFRSWVEDGAIDLRDGLTGRGYDPSWQLQSDEFFYLGNNPPVGGDFFPQLGKFAQLPPYKERRKIRQPNAWVVIAQLSDGTLAFFGSRITAKSILASDSRILRIVYADDAFDSLDSTVVTFGSDFDWIAWHDAMIVLDQKDFEQMFRDIPALQAKVDANLAKIVEHIEVANLAEFGARIKSNPTMMVKLQSIIDRADMHTRSPAELKKYATEYDIPVDWEGDKLVFDGSLEKQWSILRLLDEARTLGPVTGKHWDTSGKVQV